MNKFRTHNCAELSEKDLDKKVIISGWLHRRRDHGNLIFIDIRDHYGITQCVTENNDDHSKFLSDNQIYGPPALMFFDNKGDEIKSARIVGFIDADSFLNRLNNLNLN